MQYVQCCARMICCFIWWARGICWSTRGLHTVMVNSGTQCEKVVIKVAHGVRAGRAQSKHSANGPIYVLEDSNETMQALGWACWLSIVDGALNPVPLCDLHKSMLKDVTKWGKIKMATCLLLVCIMGINQPRKEWMWWK